MHGANPAILGTKVTRKRFIRHFESRTKFIAYNPFPSVSKSLPVLNNRKDKCMGSSFLIDDADAVKQRLTPLLYPKIVVMFVSILAILFTI